MEMVYHNEDREYGNIPDASVRHVESKICSDDDRKVAAAEPGIKRSRLAAVILGLLCVVQAAVIILLLSPFSERDEFKRTNFDVEASFKNLTEEREDLKRKLNISVSERDALKRTKLDVEAGFKTLTEEREDLKRKLNEVAQGGWEYFSGSFYYKSSVTKSWQESRDACLQKGADLVIITAKKNRIS
ncbi:C-type lectin domain family 4 member F isoform X2 [Etheostoma spectabile]|uniref:C-type lectin domain family 4 member F isoform X2 n=1 Tax=Etheostoma spectabile TaxID=54343 RepID=UPI0013AF3F3B|nr:C-type lectin domain family 4 member F-like isoform X2 [Etheostoma spectabile]